jgi:hypothetical protein
MWLQTARKLQPVNGVSSDGVLSDGVLSDGVLIDRLARVYAAAIAGVSAEPARGPITSVDHAETESAFARLAMEEAGRDAILAAVTGRELHNYAKNLRYAKLSTGDCDSKAEELMLKSVALDYPNPARVPVLRDFYQDRHVQPNLETINAPADEQARRLVSPEWALVTVGQSDEKDVHTPLRVLVDVVIGIDGHVWKAVATNSPIKSVGRAAQEAAERLCYLPQRVDGKPVQVATQVEVTVEPYRSR